MPEDATARLTRAIASGDTEAFACLYKERFDQMYAWARHGTGKDEAFCLDAVQDAFVRVIKHMKPIDTEAELGAWLRRVTLSACYDLLRKDRRRAARERGAAPPPEPGASLDEATERVMKEIAALDEPTASLIEMRYRFGWTLDRIGRAVGIKPGAVDGRLSRAAAKLRDRTGEVTDER